ncbi:MAG TPA: ROK family transcriptional regulator [Clostridiaceae bacterium]
MRSMKGVLQETIKSSNKKNVLKLLYKEKELTKQDIAKSLGLSIPTVINNINELLNEGLIEEAGVGNSTGGRKPVIIRFMPSSRYTIGVEVFKDKVRAILFNLNCQIILEYEEKLISKKENEDILEPIIKVINKLIEDSNANREIILGIGFSLPGTVNEEKLILEAAPNLKLKTVNFLELKKLFNLPIFIENEANSAAFAELTLGLGKESRNLVYISITEGLGTGIVIDGHLYKGKNKRAGEFGHTVIKAGGRPCSCGKKGCFEAYCSVVALMESYNKVSTNKISKLEDYFKALDMGDLFAKITWNTYMDYLATGIDNIIMGIDPHYIVIGGVITKHQEELLQGIKDRIFKENSFYNKEDIKIFSSKLGEYASIMGAALMPLQNLFT